MRHLKINDAFNHSKASKTLFLNVQEAHVMIMKIVMEPL